MDVTTNHQNLQSQDLTVESGRRCVGTCKTWRTWSAFDKKSNGLHGRDSRCKQCISKAKKSYKSKEKRKYREASQLRSEVIGGADQEKIERFAKIIATSIMALIDEGVIK